MEPSLRALAKLAGTVDGYEDEVNLESAISQVQAHKDVNKLVMLVAILENAANTHPFIPVRLESAARVGWRGRVPGACWPGITSATCWACTRAGNG